MATKTATMGLTKPDTNDKTEDTIADLARNFGLIDALYPVGTIYQSTQATNPGTFIGGIWTPMQGRMLVGAGTDFPAGTTGGEAKHKLTVAEMPRHKHTVKYYSSNTGNAGGISGVSGVIHNPENPLFINDEGGDLAHNNMPPYKAVYIWERTA